MSPTITTMEREVHKESTYRDKVQSLLRKHTPTFLSNSPNSSSATEQQHYASERKLIDRIVSNERTAFAYGIVLTGLVFTSVRFGPRWLAVRIGGKEKERAMKEADEVARKAGTAWMQKGLSFMIEVSFGAWAGWRGYNIVSSQNNDSFEAIAEIPLVAGRSTISDKVCTEWVDLVHKEIPQEFWQNLDSPTSPLIEATRWRSVRDFADNCVKRKAFEDMYRKKHGVNGAVVVPEGGVPKDILTKLQYLRGEENRTNQSLPKE